METKRNGILTEYLSEEEQSAGKRGKDVSYLFADDYDESKTPMHKKRASWTSSIRRMTMQNAARKNTGPRLIPSRSKTARKASDEVPVTTPYETKTTTYENKKRQVFWDAAAPETTATETTAPKSTTVEGAVSELVRQNEAEQKSVSGKAATSKIIKPLKFASAQPASQSVAQQNQTQQQEVGQDVTKQQLAKSKASKNAGQAKKSAKPQQAAQPERTTKPQQAAQIPAQPQSLEGFLQAYLPHNAEETPQGSRTTQAAKRRNAKTAEQLIRPQIIEEGPQANTKQANTKQAANTKQGANTKQANAKQANTKQANTKQAASTSKAANALKAVNTVDQAVNIAEPADSTAEQAAPAQPKTSRKKSAWPYMVMVALIVFIASLVTFLYMIRSAQSKFFLSIRDKEAPVLKVTDLDIYNNEKVTVDDFVLECDDASRVKVYLQSPIDYSIDGEQKVTIVAEDEVGHKTIRSATLMHFTDDSAPTISCDPVIRTVRGESIAYKSHISVIDNYDPEPKIEIDNSEVNLDVEGSYPVSYTATDHCGNQSFAESEVIVSAPSDETVPDEEIYALVDKILAEITTEDMQPIDKVWAIYEYVRHIPYNGRDFTYNYKYEGYKLLREQKGECYGSYSASKLFFDRLGYVNLSLEKNVGTKHFWNMVSLDGGKTFYHFDATNWHEWATRPVMCMICDSTLEEISEAHKGTHRYDHNLFPATPAESMPVPDYVPEKYGEDY